MLNYSIKDVIWKPHHRWTLPWCAVVSWMDCNWNRRVWKTLFIRDKFKKLVSGSTWLQLYMSEESSRKRNIRRYKAWRLPSGHLFCWKLILRILRKELSLLHSCCLYGTQREHILLVNNRINFCQVLILQSSFISSTTNS